MGATLGWDESCQLFCPTLPTLNFWQLIVHEVSSKHTYQERYPQIKKKRYPFCTSSYILFGRLSYRNNDDLYHTVTIAVNEQHEHDIK